MDILVLILTMLIFAVIVYKGLPIPISALLVTIIPVLYFRMPLLDTYKEVYMGGLVGFVKSYYMLLIFGALFGKVMEMSGAADSIAEKITGLLGEKFAVLAMALTSFVLMAGGISGFVALFAVFPIGKKICSKYNIPLKFLVGAYLLGQMPANYSPWMPNLQNVIPTQYFGTSVDAAWLPGLISSIVYFVVGILWLTWYQKHLEKKNFANCIMPAAWAGEDEKRDLPPFLLALAPLVVLLVSLNVFGVAVEWAILLGIVSAIVLQFKWLPIKDFELCKKGLQDGFESGLTAMILTATVVGFGSVISSTPGFDAVVALVNNLGGNPLISAAIATTALSGVCGSSSGGLGLACPILEKYYLPLCNAEALHRTAAIASMGLDSLPNCGSLNAVFTYAGVDFKDAYLPITVMLSIVLTLGQTLLFILLCPLFGLA